MNLYKDALSKGWKLTNKFPWLWIYGFFALFLASNGGEFDFYLRNIDTLTSLSKWQAGIGNFFQNFHSQWIIVAALGAVFVLAAIILIFFAAISQCSLTYAAGKKDEALTYAKTFDQAKKYVWPVLWINFLLKLSMSMLIVLLAVPYLIWNNEYYLTLVVVILIPVALAASFISKYSINFIILKQEKWFSAIKKALVLFRKNWLASLEMAGIIFLFSILLGVFIMFAAAVIIAPELSSAISTSENLLFFTDIFSTFFLAGIVLVALMAISAAIFSTWQWTSWSYLFQDFVDKPRESQIAEAFKK